MRVQEITSTIEFYANNYNLNVSLGIQNGESCFLYNNKKQLPIASLAKLFILGATIKATIEKKIAFSDKFHFGVEKFVGGSGIIKYTKQPLTLSLKDLVFLMMSYSDNIAANIILDSLSIDYVQSFVREIGANDTCIKVPMMASKEKYGDLSNISTVNDVMLCNKILIGDIPSSISRKSGEVIGILSSACGNKKQKTKFAFSILNHYLMFKVVTRNLKALPYYIRASIIDTYRKRLTRSIAESTVLAQKSATGISVFHDTCILSTAAQKTYIVAMITSPNANYSKPQSDIYKVTRECLAKIGRLSITTSDGENY